MSLFKPFKSSPLSLVCLLLTVVLYVLSFEPWNQSYLQWVAFVPLFFALDTKSETPLHRKHIFLWGFIVAFLICAGGFYWVVYATQQYGGLPWPAAISVLFLFCLIGQMHLPFYLLLRNFVRQKKIFHSRPWLWLLLSGLIYSGIESLYPKLFLDTAGNAFFKSQWWRQAADIGGAFFLTTMIVTVNELFSAALIRFLAWRKPGALVNDWLKPFAVGSSLILALSLYGYFRFQEYSALEAHNHAQPAAEKLRLSLVQANIGDFLKVESERGLTNATRKVMSEYIDSSVEAAKSKPDAIIWPETAYPALFGKPFTPNDFYSENSLREFARAFGGKMIFGGYDQKDGEDFNSIFFLDPITNETQVYHKSVLLMFGETLPFAEYFPSMKTWFPTMGFFGRGPGPQVFTVKNSTGKSFRLAPAICYEGLFPTHSAQGALMGADALLNVTNDSWFGPLGEPYLHLQITTYRSIETRLPMIRATNTGFTTEVDTTGELINESHLFQKDIIPVEISTHDPLAHSPSPYLWVSQWLGGNWFPTFTQVIAVLALALAFL